MSFIQFSNHIALKLTIVYCSAYDGNKMTIHCKGFYLSSNEKIMLTLAFRQNKIIAHGLFIEYLLF
jgi:hypothetical protein